MIMYDSFDMACHDQDTALRLNIKVNSENLLPTPQKYNVGSLRLPADPSWPKIPQRRLADDVGDLIQPPCIVTLTGTPRRSRTIVRIPQSQSCKLGASKDSGNFTSYHYSQNAQHPQSQQPKRRFGCTDPRFKKVTTVKSQMTSTSLREQELEQQTGMNCSIANTSKKCESVEDKTAVLWKKMTGAQILQQAAEKPDETKGTESIGIQTVQIISSEITSDTNQLTTTNTLAESNEQNSELSEFRSKSCSPVKSARKSFEPETPRLSSSLQNKTSRNLKNDASPENDHPCENQGNEGQFFSMVEEKVQATNHVPAEIAQLPVLSYQNVPVEISTAPQSRVDKSPPISELPIFQNIEIPKLDLSNDAVPQFPSLAMNFGNTIGKSFFNQQMDNLGFQLKSKPVDQTVLGSQKELDDLQLQQRAHFELDRKYQSIEDTISSQQESRSKYVANASNILPKPQMNENYRLQFKRSPEKLLKDICNEEKCHPQQNNPNGFNDAIPKHNFHIYCHQDKTFQSHCTNIPQKPCNIQSPQYHAATTDSEHERYRNSIDQNRTSTDGHNRSAKNGNCIYVRQQATDSKKKLVSDNMNQGFAQENYSEPFGRLNATFFDRIDDHDNKNIQPLNRKDVYFAENQTRAWDSDSKYKTLPMYEQCRATCLRQKRKMKSEQRLILNKKRVQSSEPQITNGRRETRTPYLKKTSSYLSKCYTQQLTSDSEPAYAYQYQNNTTLDSKRLFQGSQHVQANIMSSIDNKELRTRVIPHPTDQNDVKREHCMKPYERPSYKSTKISSSLDLEKQNISSHKSPRADTDVLIEKPTAIPVKTQQLLNKSYWEYYNKLKLHKMENGESPQQQYFCQVAMGAPQSKRRRAPELIVEESNNTSQTEDQVELSLPEIRTLEQCSVLSTMINKTLDSDLQPSIETIRMKQIYLNGNMRSSSDPTAGTQSAILKKLFSGDNEDSVVSSTLIYKQKHKREKHFNNKTLKLKSIGKHPVVFFGCMVYAMIIFLPMIYDYFSYEEHDEYEDLSYIEITFEYIIASFKEAFGQFFDMMNKIFFKPDARMQRLPSGKWRQKISRHYFYI